MSQDEPHITVTGDAWQYVPFGRSRLKALRATGLNYASQTFSINGATIKVRIAGKQSFIIITGSSELYMETGQLEYTSPGLANPARFDPALWHFRDVSTTDDYLGKIAATGKQSNKPALTEGMDSLAIGYPKATTGTDAEKETKDAETKEKYGDSTVLKKTIMSLFPASLFSGKMRLFMQAQYGAREAATTQKLQLGMAGTQPILNYVSGAYALQLGFWAHATPGIFTAPDGSLWLLNVRMTGGTVSTTAYAIKGPSSLVSRYKSTAPTMADDEKVKAESYIFANGAVDLAHPLVLNGCTGAAGGAMAYGWKFNKAGDKARIVVHESKGTYWDSRTVDLTFTYAPATGTAPASISVTSDVTFNGRWIDGWGTYNIFVPISETTTSPLELFSLKVTGASSFDFLSSSIYGYYKDDVWQDVKMSIAAMTGTFPILEQSESGLTFDASVNMNLSARYQYGVYPANEGWSATESSITSGDSSTISVGAFSVTGTSKAGSHSIRIMVPSAESGESAIFMNSFPQGLPGGGSPNGVVPAGYPTDTTGIPSSGLYVSTKTITNVKDVWSFSGTKFNAWALVIPGGDCEAAYVATYEYIQTAMYSHTNTTKTFVTSSIIPYRLSGDGTPVPYHPWQTAGADPGWYNPPDWSPVTTTVTNGTAPATTAVAVKCFNTAISGTTGTPGGAYDSLFAVDSSFPFYGRGMYTYTSYGKRYIMSEGLKSPASVTTAPFVGWA